MIGETIKQLEKDLEKWQQEVSILKSQRSNINSGYTSDRSGGLSDNKDKSLEEAIAVAEKYIDELKKAINTIENLSNTDYNNGIIELGTPFTFSINGIKETRIMMSDITKLNPTIYISPSSPVGKELLGKSVGYQGTVPIPSGTINLEVTAIGEYVFSNQRTR